MVWPFLRSFRWRLRLRQLLPVANAPSPAVLNIGCFLLGDRRVTGQIVDVGDDCPTTRAIPSLALQGKMARRLPE